MSGVFCIRMWKRGDLELRARKFILSAETEQSLVVPRR